MLGSGQFFQTTPLGGGVGDPGRPVQTSSPFFATPQQQQLSGGSSLLPGSNTGSLFPQSTTPSLLGNSLGFPSGGGTAAGGSLAFGQGSSISRPSPFGSSLTFPSQQQQQQQEKGFFGSSSSSAPSPFSSGFSGSIFGGGTSSSNALQQQPQSATRSLFTGANLWSSSTPPAASAGGGMVAVGAAADAAKGGAPKSLGAKCIDTWKFLVAAAKAGVWHFSSVSAAEGEASLFVGLDLSIDEHRYLFYQQPSSAWPALQQRCEQQQLEHVMNFYRQVQRQAAAEGLSFDAPPPTADFFHSAPSPALASTTSPATCFGQSTLLGNASLEQQQQQQLWPAAGSNAGGVAAVSSSSVTPAAAAATENLFPRATAASPVTAVPQQQTQQQQQPAVPARGVLSQQQQLDYQIFSMAAFRAPAFEAGKVPDVAPPKELC